MRRIAWANVRAHPLRLAANALSVVIGIAFVTGTFVFTDTVRAAFDQLFGSAAGDVDVVVRAVSAFDASAVSSSRSRVPEEELSRIEGVEGVAAVEPRYSGQAELVDASGQVLGGAGTAKQGTDVPSVEALASFELREGRFPATSEEVAVDVASARALGVEPGDQVGLNLNGPVRQFTVTGTVTLPGGLEDLAGSTLTLFDDATARQLYGEGGAVSVSVLAEDGVGAQRLRDDLAAALGTGYEVLTGEEVAAEATEQVGEILGFLTTGLLVFAGVALLVGTVIILNTFGITVAQRTRELALLQAVGADSRQVLLTVLLEAVAVGVFGSASGILVGLAVATGLRTLLGWVGVPLPSTALVLHPRTALVGLALGVTVTLIAAAGPALRASRVAPLEALRTVTSARDEQIGRRRTIAGGVLLAAGALALWQFVVQGGGSWRWWLGGGGTLAILAGMVAASPLVIRPVARLVGHPAAVTRGLPGTLAQQNALRNPRRTAATAAALVIGLGLVCFVLILVASYQASVTSVLDERFLADFQVQAANGRGFPQAATDAVRAVPGIETVSTVKLGAVGLDDGSGRIALAVDPVTLPQTFALDVTAGSLAGLSGGGGVALADGLATDLGVEVGDTLNLELVPGLPPEPFQVAATYDPVSLPGAGSVAQVLLDVGRYAASVPFALDAAVFVKLADGADPAQARAALESALAGYPGTQLVDVAQLREQYADQADQLLGLVFGLLLLSILTALVGVVNILGLSVLERIRELGLLQAVGMTRQQARAMVRWESVIIALLGALLGLAIGTGFGWVGVRAMADEGLQVFRLPLLQMAAAVTVAGFAGVLASVLPARRASRVDVLRALQAD
jgi:putative ABC transport system permease protein